MGPLCAKVKLVHGALVGVVPQNWRVAITVAVLIDSTTRTHHLPTQVPGLDCAAQVTGKRPAASGP